MLLSSLLNKIYKPEISNSLWQQSQMISEHHFLPVMKVFCSERVSKVLATISKEEKYGFLSRVHKHYFSSAKHLFKKSCLSTAPSLKYFQCLSPFNLKKMVSSRDIQKIAKVLPLDASISDTNLDFEWRLATTEEKEFNKNDRIDHFWFELLERRDDIGEIKYPNLQKVVEAPLVVGHGTEDIERGFSESKRIVTPEKSRISLRMLNARLQIRNFTKEYRDDLRLLPIPPEMILAAQNAHRSYVNYLEEEKKKKEMKDKEKKDEAERAQRKRKRDKEDEKKLQKKEKLDEKYAQITKKEKDEKRIIDELFTEASQRMAKALAAQDFAEMSKAQMMLNALLEKKTSWKCMPEKKRK